jgi:triosephosphate isomerase
MANPSCVLNFKAYSNSFGSRAVELARAADAVSQETGIQVAVCVQAVDLRAVSAAVSIPVFAQHVDDRKPGAFTGSVTAEAAKDAGAKGTLLNHSERKLPPATVKSAVARCREAGLLSLCCAATVEEAREVAGFRPDFIAIEPPELIGSGISVSTANPGIVTGSVQAVHGVDESIPVYCGAGISSGTDVRKAAELGAAGVLLASAFVNAKDPAGFLAELLGKA